MSNDLEDIEMVLDLAAEMKVDIDRFRSHGDIWEAELVEGYHEQLVAFLRKRCAVPSVAATTEGSASS